MVKLMVNTVVVATTERMRREGAGLMSKTCVVQRWADLLCSNSGSVIQSRATEYPRSKDTSDIFTHPTNMAMGDEAKNNPTLAVQTDNRPSSPSDQKTAIAAAIVAESIANRCVARMTGCVDRLRTIFDSSSERTIHRPHGATEATVAGTAAAEVAVVDHDHLWFHFSDLQDDISSVQTVPKYDTIKEARYIPILVLA
jgi:hypothetical protein